MALLAIRSERGAVSAEFAVVLPAVLIVLSLIIGAILLSAQRLTLTSAAGDVARLEARGDWTAAAARIASLPGGVQIERTTTQSLLCLSLHARPGVGLLSTLEITATGCAARSDAEAAVDPPRTAGVR